MTAVSRTEVRHEWGALAVISHGEGNKVPWVAVPSRGPGNTHREVYLPPAV